ncbi:MAG: hypothetical protein IKB43_10105 [Fibrobacter sp.]|nr:hypothetical protein [Fibrobacter sp.]MBR2470477.1 hypothetical protein [Fibrobacter sp.]
MKKIFACGAVLSLMLWACGDDTSSADVSLEESSSSQEESSLAQEKLSPPEPSSSSGAEISDDSGSAESSSFVVESSSAGSKEPSGSEEPPSELKKAGFLRGECQKDGLSMAKASTEGGATASKELPEATLKLANDGTYYVEVTDVMDYCDVREDIAQKRKADTLYVEYANMGAVSKCICNFDYHRFVIDQENADIQYFSFKEKVFQIVRFLGKL